MKILLFFKSRVRAYTTKRGTFVAEHDDNRTSKQENPPRVESKNKGYGFHGEASAAHHAAKHGHDFSYGRLSEKDHNAGEAHADKAFAGAANWLVKQKIAPNHAEAVRLLDSSLGRHLHDALERDRRTGKVNYDLSKVPWLKKSAAEFFKQS